MNIENPESCAFPAVETDNGILFHEGLTKREHFAGLAMQGMSSHPEFYCGNPKFADGIAKDSVKFADALLKELAK